MNWSWERKIRHFDRRVSPLGMRGLRLQVLAMRVRDRRRLPPDTVPHELVFDRILRRTATQELPLVKRPAWIMLRHKLTHRQQATRLKAYRARRPRLADTGIFGAQRRQAWLKQMEAMPAGRK